MRVHNLPPSPDPPAQPRKTPSFGDNIIPPALPTSEDASLTPPRSPERIQSSPANSARIHLSPSLPTSEDASLTPPGSPERIHSSPANSARIHLSPFPPTPVRSLSPAFSNASLKSLGKSQGKHPVGDKNRHSQRSNVTGTTSQAQSR